MTEAAKGQRQWLHDLRRAVLWHRRLLAAGLAAAAVAMALSALSPDPPPTVVVLVAARDLDGGVRLADDDVVAARLPAGMAPEGALTVDDVPAGRLLAAPVRRGEPITDVRLVGPSLVDGYGAGLVAAPVRLADAGTVGLLRPGDLVDVLVAEAVELSGDGSGATDAGASGIVARTVAPGVRVAAVPRREALAASGAPDGGLVVLATTPAVAADLARSAVSGRLSVVLRPD